ncbi:MAG: YfiR family protein [Bacteroidales bacterium]|nr:YfiR family protein [Bacteroidales bacterium]
MTGFLCVFSFSALAQENQEKIKASMLYYLCEYIEWPADKSETNTMNFGLLGTDVDFYNELKLIAESKKKLHGKQLNIQQLTENNIPESIHVLCLGEAYYGQAERIFEFCKSNSVLFVTDEFENQMFTVINFLFNKQDNAIKFSG